IMTYRAIHSLFLLELVAAEIGLCVHECRRCAILRPNVDRRVISIGHDTYPPTGLVSDAQVRDGVLPPPAILTVSQHSLRSGEDCGQSSPAIRLYAGAGGRKVNRVPTENSSPTEKPVTKTPTTELLGADASWTMRPQTLVVAVASNCTADHADGVTPNEWATAFTCAVFANKVAVMTLKPR